VVDALQAAAIDDSGERIFNVGSGKGRSVREIIASIETQLGTRLTIECKPGRPIDVPVSTLSNARSRDVLGWKPTTLFEEGLRRTIEWWRRDPPAR
jgi:UDP-glucose 4-epimerase